MKQSLARHNEYAHQGIKYDCNLCGFKLSSKKNLSTHTKTQHFKEKKYQCTICDFKATQNSNLKSHVRNVHENYLYEDIRCTKCSYQTKDKYRLKRHFKNYHSEQQTKFKCQFCTYEHQIKSTVERH